MTTEAEALERATEFLLLWQGGSHSDIIAELAYGKDDHYPLLASDLEVIITAARKREDPPGDQGPSWKVEQARRGEQTVVRRRGRGRPW